MNDREPTRRKRLGQYFTGIPVARLLAALANAERARCIIDPMVGSGDMLQACLEVGCQPDVLVGVELDADAAARASHRLRGVEGSLIIAGDAFSSDLPRHQFDLVITNPPYIRYQSSFPAGDVAMQSASKIRRSLMCQIDRRQNLSYEAKNVLINAAERYPGTSDVAVPAWILSAALVAEDGTLAIVVPQAWLSRNYAAPIREMLDRAFTVEVIVQDGDVTWFDDAQVRTHLLVAKRRPVDGNRTGRSRVIVGRATKQLRQSGYLTGGLGSERQVATALRALTSSQSQVVTVGLAGQVEGRVAEVDTGQSMSLSPQIAHSLRGINRRAPTRTLESLGWRCGQGMRTGANEFFYVTAADRDVIETAPRWQHRRLAVPEECLIPAVRRQSDIRGQVQTPSNTLTTRLLNLRNWITGADLAAALAAGVSKCWLDGRYAVLPEDVGSWISEVEATPLSDRDPSRRIPGLTAVVTNVKTGQAREPLSLWYHLPPLAPRHRPELFIPRVCGGRPYAYINPDYVVVDANFATMWRTDKSALPTHAMLAILNSTWIWANLEQNCTVLGGGALKVEATDLRRLRFPDLDDLAIDELNQLGKRLDTTTNAPVLAEIDWLTSKALTSASRADDLAATIDALASQGLQHRSTRPEP